MKTRLILTCGGRGGVGKTLALVAVADYLHSKGYKLVPTDCDTENRGKVSSFAYWFDGKTLLLNLRNTEDCDKLLSGSATSGAPFVLADLPANASGDIAGWWKEVVTPDNLKELDLEVTAIGVVTPQAGSAESVWEWIETLGGSIGYLVALNRLIFERVPSATEDVFDDWFRLQPGKDISVETFELCYLHGPALEALTDSRKLPSRAIKGTDIHVLLRSRIKAWIERIHSQLDKLTAFKAPGATQEVATK